MAKLILHAGENRKFIDIMNETISGLRFSFDTLTGMDASTRGSLEGYDCEIVRYQDGVKKEEIFNGSLYDLCALTFPSDHFAYEERFCAKRVGIGTNGVNSFDFSFGTNYVLKAGSSIRVTVSNQDFGANPNILTVDSLSSVGLQAFIPRIDVYGLEATKTQHELNLGSNVTKIVYIAEDDALNMDLKKVSLTSDKLKTEDYKETIYRHRDFVIKPAYTKQFSELLYGDSKNFLNNVNLKLDFDSAEPNRKIIVFRSVMTKTVIDTLTKKTMEHRTENVEAVLKNTDTSNCKC